MAQVPRGLWVDGGVKSLGYSRRVLLLVVVVVAVAFRMWFWFGRPLLALLVVAIVVVVVFPDHCFLLLVFVVAAAVVVLLKFHVEIMIHFDNHFMIPSHRCSKSISKSEGKSQGKSKGPGCCGCNRTYTPDRERFASCLGYFSLIRKYRIYR